MIENICHTCTKVFVKKHNPNRRYKYCSIECMGKDKDKGKNHSKNMIGKTPWNKGLTGLQPWMNISGIKNITPWNKGLKGVLTAWNKGVPNKDFWGEKNPNWKGGCTKINDKIRKSIKYKEWREKVFSRDNYTCQICGESKSGRLQADHIKPFAYFEELRFDVSNGRTLCIDCHKNTDTYLNKARWNYEGIKINRNNE